MGRPSSAASPPVTDPAGARILLASADPLVVAAATPVLQAAGYRLLVVSTGPDVLHYVDDQAVDLYLIDPTLPGISGLRIARHLRASYGIVRERIVVLNPAAAPFDYSLEIQPQDILITPFTGVELLLCVMRHLAGERGD